MKRMYARQGLTLIEMMVASGMLIVVSMTSVQLMTEQTQLFHVVTNRADIDDRLRIALGAMTTELQQATRSVPLTATSLQVIDPETLVFYLPTDQDSDGTIVDSIGNIEWDLVHPISYRFDTGAKRLIRTDSNGTRVLLTDVASVRFDDSSTDSSLYAEEVKVQINMQRSTVVGRVVSTSDSRIVHLRN